MAKANQSKNSEMSCNMKKRKPQRKGRIQKMGRRSSSQLKQLPKKNQPKDYSKLTNAQKFAADIKILKDGFQSHRSEGMHHQTNKAYCFNVFQRIINDGYLNKLITQRNVFEKRIENINQKLLQNFKKARKTVNLVESVYSIMEKFNYTGVQKKFLTATGTQITDIKRSLFRKIEFCTTLNNPEVSYLNQHSICSSETNEEKLNNVSLNPEFSPLPNFASSSSSNSKMSSQYRPDTSDPLKMCWEPEFSLMDFTPLNTDTEKVTNQLELQKLKKEKEEIVQLLGKLQKEQSDLEAARREINEKMNNIQENADSEQKKMAVQLTEIRERLKDKITSNNQISPIFENCLKSVTCQGILWDIRWLVEEGVQLKVGTSVTESSMAPNYIKVTQNEVHLVILIASLLKVFPVSVSTEFIHSNIRNVDAEISQQDIESLMNKFPAVFRAECLDVKPLEKKWRYLNFSPVITI